MPWELRVALRYLTARRKQAFISLISGVAILGVAVGVMALLIALGLMTGLQSEIRSRILGATAHVSVFRIRSEPLGDYGPVIEKVRGVPGVAGAAPALHGQVLLTSGSGGAVAQAQGDRSGAGADGHGGDGEESTGGAARAGTADATGPRPCCWAARSPAR